MKQPEEHTIDAGGFTTHYLESVPEGEPEATVVLVHEGAIGADARTCWSGVMPLLAERYRVLAPDLLGYGDSAKVVYLDRQPYDFRVDHLAAFCEAVGVGPEGAHFAGHSFGGSLVLRTLATPSPRLPARSGVSISGSGGPWRTPAATQELSRFDGTEQDIRRMLTIMVDDFPGFEDNVRLRYANTRKPGHVEACLALRLKHPAPLQASGASGGRPWPAGLRDCPVPVMVVGGDRDVLLEPGWTDHFAEATPRVSVRRLDSKHAPNIDRPETVADLLARFFSTSDERPGRDAHSGMARR
jgi:pimeloyl-ACP methyl ester carboxylesterase